jgi:integrase
MRRSKWQDGSVKMRGKRRKVWFARYRVNVMQPDGTIERQQVGRVIGTVAELPTKRAAEIRLRELIREADFATPKVAVTFGEFVQRWEESVLPNYKPSTRKAYRGILRLYLLPRFQDAGLADITTPEIQSVISVLAKRLSPESVKRVWDLASGLFRVAVEWKWVGENPCKGVRLPKRFRKPQPAVDPATAARLFSAVGEPYATLLTLFAITGFRRSEVFALRWKCVNWELGLIGASESVVDGQWGTPKGQSETRFFPLPGWVLDRLRSLWERAGRPEPERPMFASRTGRTINPSNVLNRHLWPACDRLGVPRCSFHSFRRGIATAQVLAGTDPKTMQAWLGHKDVQTTLNHYAMANANRLRGAVEAWGEQLRAAEAANLSASSPKLSTSEYQFTEIAKPAMAQIQ